MHTHNICTHACIHRLTVKINRKNETGLLTMLKNPKPIICAQIT